MLRMTRPLSSGIVKIMDRKPKLDKDGKQIKGEFEKVVHILRPADGPKPKMKKVQVMKRDSRGDIEKDKDGKPIPYVKNDKPVMELKQDGCIPAKGKEYHDEDFVLSQHGSIMEKCK